MLIKPAAWRLALFLCALPLTIAACAKGGSPAPAGTSPAWSASSAAPAPVSDAAVCADAGALRASWDKLKNVTIARGLADEIKSDLNGMKSALATFVNDAHGRWQAQTDTVKAALAALGTAVDELVANPGPARWRPYRRRVSGSTPRYRTSW